MLAEKLQSSFFEYATGDVIRGEAFVDLRFSVVRRSGGTQVEGSCVFLVKSLEISEFLGEFAGANDE